jgi:hypothetical protein
MPYGIMMRTATLVLFQLPRAKNKIAMNKACKLYRALYGYNNSSCYGRYHTRVEGLIDKVQGIRLFKSAIIVKNEDAEMVLELLKEYRAEVISRKVIVSTEDATQLGMQEKK